MSNSDRSYRHITASEIGDYAYCQRQWWLKRVHNIRSVNTERMAQGTISHEEHWRQVRKISQNRRNIVIALFAAVSMFILFILSLIL